MDGTPTIKGLFIHSHIKRLRVEKGDQAVERLERMLGKKLRYALMGDYPVREEIEIIRGSLDLLTGGRYTGNEREFEAGRLHARNFLSTTLGILITLSVPKTAEGFRALMLRSGSIARHVFKNTNFSARSEEGHLIVSLENNDYSIEHFRGFFQEMMVQWGLQDAAVDAHESAPKKFEYTLAWERAFSFNFIWQ